MGFLDKSLSSQKDKTKKYFSSKLATTTTLQSSKGLPQPGKISLLDENLNEVHDGTDNKSECKTLGEFLVTEKENFTVKDKQEVELKVPMKKLQKTKRVKKVDEVVSFTLDLESLKKEDAQMFYSRLKLVKRKKRPILSEVSFSTISAATYKMLHFNKQKTNKKPEEAKFQSLKKPLTHKFTLTESDLSKFNDKSYLAKF